MVSRTSHLWMGGTPHPLRLHPRADRVDVPRDSKMGGYMTAEQYAAEICKRFAPNLRGAFIPSIRNLLAIAYQEGYNQAMRDVLHPYRMKNCRKP